ncbi:unnamed protein product [Rotaria socialis]|uniref:UDP-N-acetylglucosamine 2-epimerase (non-hydrolyzing) n=1 Tax=Rotaria socialis TaxID=392032 RepID=A0A820G5B6_9BILA|nr:unnamed protein product [Rotaria socialis]CAF4270547.1 unnamed protein product [Rotaria socialis]
MNSKEVGRVGLLTVILLLFCYVIMSNVLVKNNKDFFSPRRNIFRVNHDRATYRYDHSKINSVNSTHLPKVLIVLGTRPEGIKCAPLIAELKSDYYRSRFEVIVLSTGQHQQMLRQALIAFQQKIDIDLNLMTHNQTLSDLFNRVFSEVANQINIIRPNLLIVQGDTTTALASSLASAYHSIPVAHVEAGLRSFNLLNPYPEELNRKIIDSFAKLMFAPTTFAKEVLVREGACETDIFTTGNTGVDAFYHHQNRTYTMKNASILRTIDNFKKNFTSEINSTIILVTMHRRENFEYLSDMCRAVATIAKEHEKNVLIIFPVHPNPNVKHVVFNSFSGLNNVKIVDPISYEIFGHVLSQSDIVMTDSGGIQEEAVSIGKSVILMRMTTERPEGIYLGTIKQIGVLYDEIVQATNLELINVKSKNRTLKTNIFGDGQASKKIAAIIDNYFYQGHRPNSKCTTKFRQDSIARAVYSNLNASIQTPLSHTLRRNIINNLTKVRSALTLNELLKIPSRYNVSLKTDQQFAITAVIGIYRREGLIRRWIEALLLQTHPPKEIWIIYFASPIPHKLNLEIQETRSLFANGSNHCNEWCTQKKCDTSNNSSNGILSNCIQQCLTLCKQLPSMLFVAMGEMQLKYFGRFQLSLQCQTKYVIVFDDDCIPQIRYFETALHTINTEPYRGILGTKGTPASESYYYGPVSKTNQIIEADVVGGSWFMESEWVKLMFHDKMQSWNTGEDFHLCANARKYANIRSFVMPVDANDISTHSFSNDYLSISDRGDTTGRVAGTASSRRHIVNQLWLRGDRLMDSYKKSRPALLVYAETNNDALMLIENVRKQMAKLSGSIHFVTSNVLKTNLVTSEIKKMVVSFHDFMVGRDYGSDPTPITAAAEVLYAFDMVMQGTQSTAILILGSSSTGTLFALVAAAFLRNIPIINIYMENSVIDVRTAEAILAMSSVTIRVFGKLAPNSLETEQLNHILLELYQ